MHLDRLEPGASELTLRVEEHHVNLMGVLHGGVVASLADAATGIAMLSALEDGWSHLTTSLQLTFLSPARLGQVVTARGRVLKAGRRFGYAEADVEGPDGSLIARASASFTILAERADQ
jgi:acyl-CoA thioesterase